MIYTGNCLDILPILEAESVQCCVTSPPYYGLRDYGTATWAGGDPVCDHIDEVAAAEQRRNRKGLANNADENDGATRSREVQNGIDKAFQYKVSCPKCGATRIDSQIGLEPTPEAYVEKLVAVFRELRRVLRDDGTVWLNLGDSYWGGKGQSAHADAEKHIKRFADGKTLQRPYQEIGKQGETNNKDGKHDVIKPKNLIGIPWRVAFALQADGWHLRQDIIWAKPNPMPESVADRCTKSHEYIFLLTKSARYYYDAEAVKEPALRVGDIPGGDNKRGVGEFGVAPHAPFNGPVPSHRNKRSVWTITTKPFKEAHFATFPPEIPEICIKAGTSEKGCCPECGSPWERVMEKSGGSIGKGSWTCHDEKDAERGMVQNQTAAKKTTTDGTYKCITTGWRPTCTHNNTGIPPSPVPCTVIDPFSGAGTTGMVAEKLGRKYIGIDIKPAYSEMAKKRIEAVRLPLFNEISP